MSSSVLKFRTTKFASSKVLALVSLFLTIHTHTHKEGELLHIFSSLYHSMCGWNAVLPLSIVSFIQSNTQEDFVIEVYQY